MSRAGFAKVELSASAVGAELVGYANRDGGARAVHDPLFARAMVLEAGGERVAVCALDLCYAGEDVVAAARRRVAARGLLPADALFVSTTHTHSGPHDIDPQCFPDGLDALIDTAVAEACARLEPAQVGAGWGAVHGHTLNRRRLEEPVDPTLLALRVDALDGRPLGVWYGFGCHPVVLGPDSNVVSGDFAGHASALLEAQLGGGAVALFGQGAGADVNPLTPAVHDALDAERAVLSTAGLRYYGPGEPSLEIGDRRGGTFAEVERLGRAVAEEALRVRHGIVVEEVERVWTQALAVVQPTERPVGGTIAADHALREFRETVRVPREQALEVMLVGIDGPGVLLVGQPGEPFAETGVALRRELRGAGVRHPFAVGYANGFRAYLPPSHAFADGGYEVGWAWALGLPEHVQDDIRAAVLQAVRAHEGESS